MINCQNCEHRILNECIGFDKPVDCGSFLDNIYGLASNSKELADMEQGYKARSNIANATPEELKEMIISDVLNIDVHLYGIKSECFPVWNFRRAISVIHQLEIYQRLNVNLTLNDYRGESFYAGIPSLTPDDIRIFKGVNYARV